MVVAARRPSHEPLVDSPVGAENGREEVDEPEAPIVGDRAKTLVEAVMHRRSFTKIRDIYRPHGIDHRLWRTIPLQPNDVSVRVALCPRLVRQCRREYRQNMRREWRSIVAAEKRVIRIGDRIAECLEAGAVERSFTGLDTAENRDEFHIDLAKLEEDRQPRRQPRFAKGRRKPRKSGMVP